MLKLFDVSPDMTSMGTTALRILAASWFISTIGLVLASVFQALSLASYSMYLTLSRQVILPFAFVFLFKGMGNLTLIWATFILAEIIAIPLGSALWKKTQKYISVNMP